MASESLREQLKDLSEKELLVLDSLAKITRRDTRVALLPVSIARVNMIREELPKGVNLSSKQVSYILHKLEKKGIIVAVGIIPGAGMAKYWSFLNKAKFEKYEKLRRLP